MHKAIDNMFYSFSRLFMIYKEKSFFLSKGFKFLTIPISFILQLIFSLAMLVIDGVILAFEYARYSLTINENTSDILFSKSNELTFKANIHQILIKQIIALVLLPLYISKFCVEGACNFLILLFTFSKTRIYK